MRSDPVRRIAHDDGMADPIVRVLRLLSLLTSARIRRGQDLADRLGVTPSTLTRACRAVTGRSPADLIHERLLAEARRLLCLGSRNVSGVAYALGFEPAYFSRFFRRHEGVSPAAYQRRHGGSS